MIVTRFDPATATAAELTGYAAVAIAASAADRPQDPAPTTESVTALLRAVSPPLIRLSYWAARDGNRIAGTGLLVLMDDENAAVAVVDITVHPGFRRRGLGTALLRELAAVSAAAGRTVVMLQTVIEGGAGQAWAAAHGFAVAQRSARLVLAMPVADQSAWPLDAAAGYRLARWAGAVPDDYLASYATAKSAMQDAPMGQMSARAPAMTPQLLRGNEASLRASGRGLLIVAAIAARSAEVAGLTEIVTGKARPDVALQRDTVVLSGHRGHGLGLAMKAANLRWVAADYPAVRQVRTGTAVDNEHMLRVNRQLGFAVDQITQTCELPLADLTARLAAVPGAPR
jgi:mycothiol synthase